MVMYFNKWTEAFITIDDFYIKMVMSHANGQHYENNKWNSPWRSLSDQKTYPHTKDADDVMEEEYGLVHDTELMEYEKTVSRYERIGWQVVDKDKFLVFKMTYL